MKHWIAALLLFAAVADERSAHDFVQSFYQRYAAHHFNDDSILTTKPPLLVPALSRALKEDLEASKKSPDEIVGLDFDPYVNSQDPCPRYEVGKVTMRGAGRASVAIHSVCEGKRSPKPDVIADVVFSDGRWQFENFEYPGEHTDLRTVLKKLAQERK